MSSENKGENVRLHHSINTDTPAGSSGSDFAAGFSDDDDGLPSGTQAGEVGDDGAPAGDPPGAAGDPPGGDPSQGVDTSGNGGQVSPQPQGLNLDELPENLRQSVGAILAEKQRLEAESVEHRRNFDSLHSRIAPVQRELEATKRELARRQQTQAPTQQSQLAATQNRPTMVGAAMAQFETPEFKQYESLFPDEAAIHKRNTLAVAEANDLRIGQLEGVLGNTAQRIQQIEAASEKAARREELSELDKVHPDWREINTSDDFWDYFGEIEHLFGFADEADKTRRLQNRRFVSGILDTYKKVRGIGAEPQTQTQASPGTQPQPASAVVALAAAPRNAGGGIRRTAGEGRKGNDFMAGFNSED